MVQGALPRPDGSSGWSRLWCGWDRRGRIRGIPLIADDRWKRHLKLRDRLAELLNLAQRDFAETSNGIREGRILGDEIVKRREALARLNQRLLEIQKHVLGKITALLQSKDRALVVCLDNPEWHGANLEVNLDKIKPKGAPAPPDPSGLEIQGSNGVN